MIGETLDAKYRIDRQLGAGGMGNVFLATHLWTTRPVALKVIAPKWAAEPHFLARFQREAQACGQLRHPNIVNVTDFGIARTGNGDMPYLVMEYLDGETLSDFQKTHPKISLPVVADLLDQIGLALAEAHGHGIVHRDLKPDNIWLEPNGRGGYTVKVLDFGVAKVNLLGEWTPRLAPAASHSGEAPAGGDEMATVVMGGGTEEVVTRLQARAEETETIALPPGPSSFSPDAFDSGASAKTMPGSWIGTPAYMSPEQALGKEIDFRSDIYSLAVVAYSLVCGELPFSGKASELIEFHKTGAPRPPSSVCKVPGDVSDAILAGLARDPGNRPPTAVEFTRRFHNAVDAEFFALRRSKSFLLQHLAAFALLLIPIYGGIVGVTAILASAFGNLVPGAALRALIVSVVAAIFFVFADNLLRASAALMALDEQVRIRKFLSFRVFWKLIRATPVLLSTQARALVTRGPGWIIGDCLWPVVCVVEKVSGIEAIRRSRSLMTGLRSAGRALAIRHLALAGLAIADVLKSLGVLLRKGYIHEPNVVVTSTWFPLFAIFAAAPLFLYDRTAANPNGPLLQLDRTPEVRITSRALSVSSIIWVVLGALYLLYQPIKVWLFGL